MIIKWNENPLKTVIELDEFEEKEFKYKVNIQELKDRISYALYLVDSDEIDPDDKLSRIKSALEDDEGSCFIKGYINSLSDIHCGDCTCIPYSCTKCFAEGILGIDTIKGLRKHEGNAVCSAFEKGKNIDGAIKHLKEYEANPIPGSWRDKHPDLWDSSVDRWIKEARSAAEWLENYKEEHKGEFHE